jgi:hypothetical protein
MVHHLRPGTLKVAATRFCGCLYCLERLCVALSRLPIASLIYLCAASAWGKNEKARDLNTRSLAGQFL